MLRANTVVRSQELSIEIAENDVDHEKVLVRLDMINPDRHGIVPVVQLVKVVVAGPSVSPHLRPRLHVGHDDQHQRSLRTVWDELETQPACDDAAPVYSTVLRTLTGG